MNLMFAALLSLPGSGDIPDLETRLERLQAQMEQRRQDQHIPGMALAVVHGDRIVLARGFGQRDLDGELPAEADSLWAIGSTTKAFTAMLIGMLQDEGRMSFEDSPARWLEGFRFADAEIQAEVQLIDLLSHRTGLTRQSLAWYGNGATRPRVLEAVAKAQTWAPFRSAFLYNNVMYLAAGEASARAAGCSWEELLEQRILGPLGMDESHALAGGVLEHPRRALGYRWQDGAHRALPFRVIDNCAPAGSIVSSVLDMSQWLRFLIAGGRWEEQSLVQPETLEQMWSPHGAGGGYGLGWFLRDRQGERIVEHGGNIDGYSAMVGLIPERELGYVLLTNLDGAPLQQQASGLVFETLLGERREEPSAVEESTPPAESWSVAQKRVRTGRYDFGAGGFVARVDLEGSRLQLSIPGQPSYLLREPDSEGRLRLDVLPEVWVSFDEPRQGWVPQMSLFQNGVRLRGEHLEDIDPDLPITLDELMDLRAEQLGSDAMLDLGVVVLRGSCRLVHTGVEGTLVWAGDGEGSTWLEVDFGDHGCFRRGTAGGRGFSWSTAQGRARLDGDELAAAALVDPVVLGGDWRDHFDEVRVDRLDQAGRREAIRVTGFAVGGGRRNLLLDPEDGRVLVEEGSSSWSLLGGVADLHHEDWRDLEGVQFPFRLWWEAAANGRSVFQFEDFETDSDFDIAGRVAAELGES